jgi:hypothetical protein
MTVEKSELEHLPAPPIDPAFSARLQRRARSALRERDVLHWAEAGVPALLLLAGLFYVASSLVLMVRIFVG